MLSLERARQLRDFGVLWEPAPGDRFTVDVDTVDGEVFWISHLTIDVHVFQGQPVIGFNGTTEWALDSVTLDTALWLPREDQLRALLGGRLLGVDAPAATADASWVVRTTSGTTSDPDLENAYATALLTLP